MLTSLVKRINMVRFENCCYCLWKVTFQSWQTCRRAEPLQLNVQKLQHVCLLTSVWICFATEGPVCVWMSMCVCVRKCLSASSTCSSTCQQATQTNPIRSPSLPAPIFTSPLSEINPGIFCTINSHSATVRPVGGLTTTRLGSCYHILHFLDVLHPILLIPEVKKNHCDALRVWKIDSLATGKRLKQVIRRLHLSPALNNFLFSLCFLSFFLSTI